MDIKLLPHQYSFINSNNFVTIMLCSRGAGKSYAAGVLIGLKLLNGFSGIGVAPIYTTLREVLIPSTIQFLTSAGVSFTYNKSENKITLSNGASVIFISGDNAERLRGFTDKHFLIIDEAVLCSESVYTLGIACLRGINVKNPQVYLMSTPGGSSHWTSKIAKNTNNLHITADIFKNKHNGAAYVENMLREYQNLPEAFVRRELYGEIVDLDSNSMFNRGEWTILTSNSEHKPGKTVIGIDVAGGGDYTSICAINGNRIICIEKMLTPELDDLRTFVFSHCSRLNPDVIRVDTGGIGHFLPQELQKIFANADVQGINFGCNAKKPYYNKRAEMYADIKDRIAEGLHFSPAINKKYIAEIEEELFATPFIDKNGLLALPDKSIIKRSISRSPDLTDSLALAAYDINSETERNNELRQLNATAIASNPFSRQKTNQKQSWNRI